VDLGIEGRVAVVSGASRGIGRAIAGALAAEGVRVVLAARTVADLEAAAAELDRLHPGQIEAISTDLRDPEAVRLLVERATARFGQVDIVVSNVIGHVIDAAKEGDGPTAGTFASTEAGEYGAEFSHLLVSAWALAMTALPQMRSRRWGRILNVGSGVAREPMKELPHVLPNTVRPAVAGMHRILARRLAPEGITVNSLLTGSILTERNRSYWEWLAAERQQPVAEVMRVMTDVIPAGRMGEPAEMAAVATFLASERAGRITGQSIPVDGGINRHL
jgi:3-oxoacyl-[acyl-carrier protein] reductase